jgi:hypothetical protein
MGEGESGMAPNSLILIAIVAATLTIASCNAQAEIKGIARHTENSCSEMKLDDRFFRGVFDTREQHIDGDVSGIAEFLQSVGEPSISCAVQTDEAYRLIFLPERGSSVALRAQRRDDRYELIVSRPQTKSTIHSLDQADWNKLTSAIEHYNFWSRSPYPSSSIPDDSIELHGAVWVLEGQKGNWYHAVSRLSSFKEKEFDRPSKAFFDIAKTDFSTP